MFNLTTNEDFKQELEYDEILGFPIYGWSIKKNHPVYKPKIGVSKQRPNYKVAGKKWKAVLLERWIQRSVLGGDDTKLDDFDGIFHESIIMKRFLSS
tara:strand:+ start:1199 stop:1489 length:291 start_codon:yes stop_codon:yes gene_type:complete